MLGALASASVISSRLRKRRCNVPDNLPEGISGYKMASGTRRVFCDKTDCDWELESTSRDRVLAAAGFHADSHKGDAEKGVN